MEIEDNGQVYIMSCEDDIGISLGVCKPKGTCNEKCTAQEIFDDDCPCSNCTADPDNSSVQDFVDHIIDNFIQ